MSKLKSRFKEWWSNVKKNSIRNKLFLYSFLLIAGVVILFELFALTSLRDYHYQNTAGLLHNQVRYSTDLYRTLLSDEELMDIIIDNKDQFYRTNKTQVQLLSNKGVVLFDSTGSPSVGETLNTEDVIEAQMGREKSFVGFNPYGQEKVLSVSAPINNQTKQVGIMRLTTSLREVDEIIGNIGFFYMAVGGFLLLVSFALTIFMANSITKPIVRLTAVAKKLADGQYQEKAEEDSEDEIGELGRTLNLMSDNIVRKEQIKNDFISSVSHELRTPLTSIKGWAVTLQGNEDDPEINEEGLKIIEKEADRLSSMVEDLLDFSRFTSNRITLVKKQFDLVEVASNIISQLRPRTQQHKLNMVLNYSDPEILVIADEGRMKQVFLNILDNAMKFTEDGGTIITDIQEVEDDVHVAITDTGIGIEEDEISFVTEKFWKGSSSKSHAGLGLSICEEIIKAHGGTLAIESEAGVGTTVSFKFPKEMA